MNHSAQSGHYQLPPPNFMIPDMSKPPPGFNAPPSFIQPPINMDDCQAHTEPLPVPEETKPTVPYYELPAGLMVPLIRLEDCSYRHLDPEDIRLPAPIPPSERLLQAIEAFYSLPSHDRPRDGYEIFTFSTNIFLANFHIYIFFFIRIEFSERAGRNWDFTNTTR